MKKALCDHGVHPTTLVLLLLVFKILTTIRQIVSHTLHQTLHLECQAKKIVPGRAIQSLSLRSGLSRH